MVNDKTTSDNSNGDPTIDLSSSEVNTSKLLGSALLASYFLGQIKNIVQQIIGVAVDHIALISTATTLIFPYLGRFSKGLLCLNVSSGSHRSLIAFWAFLKVIL